MALEFRSAAAGEDTGDFAEVTVPSDVEPGDLLIAVVSVNSNIYETWTPDGWVALQAGIAGSSWGGLYMRRAEAGDADRIFQFPSTATGGSAKEIVSLAAYYSDTPNKYAAVGSSAVRLESSSSADHNIPDIDVEELPCIVVTGIAKKGSTVTTLTPPSGFTLRGTPAITGGSSNNGTAIADQAAESTGTVSGVWSTGVANRAAQTFSLTIVEADAPVIPPLPKPVMRRWNGVSWSLIG